MVCDRQKNNWASNSPPVNFKTLARKIINEIIDFQKYVEPSYGKLKLVYYFVL